MKGFTKFLFGHPGGWMWIALIFVLCVVMSGCGKQQKSDTLTGSVPVFQGHAVMAWDTDSERVSDKAQFIGHSPSPSWVSVRFLVDRCLGHILPEGFDCLHVGISRGALVEYPDADVVWTAFRAVVNDCEKREELDLGDRIRCVNMMASYLISQNISTGHLVPLQDDSSVTEDLGGGIDPKAESAVIRLEP